MPASLAPSSALVSFFSSMLVQVRCMLVLRSKRRWASMHSSRVRSLVLPPAPHVTSAYSGFCAAMRPMRLYRFLTPSSVRGGSVGQDRGGGHNGGRRRMSQNRGPASNAAPPRPRRPALGQTGVAQRCSTDHARARRRTRPRRRPATHVASQL